MEIQRKKNTDEGKFLFTVSAEDVDQCQDADNSPHSLATLNNAHVMTRGR